MDQHRAILLHYYFHRITVFRIQKTGSVFGEGSLLSSLFGDRPLPIPEVRAKNAMLAFGHRGNFFLSSLCLAAHIARRKSPGPIALTVDAGR